MERTVTIGCQTQEELRGLIDQLVDAVEKGEEPELYVKGNGASTPDLVLRFSVENDSEYDGPPVVDYDEG
jgi:hypothetical protein